MKKIKHVNPKDLLHKVYTEDGGVKEYNKNQQAVGALKFAGAIWLIQRLGHIVDRIEKLPIKALGVKKNEDPSCS